MTSDDNLCPVCGGKLVSGAVAKARQTHTITVPGWRPASLNQLISGHWRTKHALKKRDMEMVAGYGHAVPKPTGKRRVDLSVTLTARQKECDVDALWKSTLDSLVRAGLLLNDTAAWCELGVVTYQRGKVTATTITLTDLA